MEEVTIIGIDLAKRSLAIGGVRQRSVYYRN